MIGQIFSRYFARSLILGLLFCFTFVFPVAADTAGANSPATTVDDATVGTLTWSNPNNAQTNNGVFATATFAGCFIAGTLIETPMGEIPIEDIRPGQEVYGFDANQNVVTAKVNAIESLQVNELVVLMTDTGLVVTTSAHPFYVGNNTFKLVQDLEVGDILYDFAFTKHPLLIKIPLWVPTTPVYNLNVDNIHTFFGNGFAVHNKA